MAVKVALPETIQNLIKQIKTKLNLKQSKTLDTPITVDGTSQTTVEGALSAINDKSVQVTVDSEMSTTSENPVQNKVITENLGRKANFFVCECTTEASTTAKTVTLEDSAYTPQVGDIFQIQFTNGNTAGAPTLSINGGTAYNIRMYSMGSSYGGISYPYMRNMIVRWDGTYYVTIASDAPCYSQYSVSATYDNSGYHIARRDALASYASSSNTYKYGNLLIQSGNLYRCKNTSNTGYSSSAFESVNMDSMFNSKIALVPVYKPGNGWQAKTFTMQEGKIYLIVGKENGLGGLRAFLWLATYSNSDGENLGTVVKLIGGPASGHPSYINVSASGSTLTLGSGWSNSWTVYMFTNDDL